MRKSIKEQSNAARERILKSLTVAAANTNGSVSERDRSVRVFPPPTDLLQTFVQELEALKGQVVVANTPADLEQQLKQWLKEQHLSTVFCLDDALVDAYKLQECTTDSPDQFKTMDAGITRCEFLVARSGSVLVSSAHPSGRRMNVFPPVHIVLAKSSQLVAYIEDAITGVQERYAENMPSQITLITGASRTADIEKTLVMGAHGPKQLIVFIDMSA